MAQVFISFWGRLGFSVCLFFQAALNLTSAFFVEAFTVFVAIQHRSGCKSGLRSQDMVTEKSQGIEAVVCDVVGC